MGEYEAAGIFLFAAEGNVCRMVSGTLNGGFHGFGSCGYMLQLFDEQLLIFCHGITAFIHSSLLVA